MAYVVGIVVKRVSVVVVTTVVIAKVVVEVEEAIALVQGSRVEEVVENVSVVVVTTVVIAKVCVGVVRVKEGKAETEVADGRRPEHIPSRRRYQPRRW